MVCYRLDSTLKTKLLELLDYENISLFNFHRLIEQSVLADVRLSTTLLSPVLRNIQQEQH